MIHLPVGLFLCKITLTMNKMILNVPKYYEIKFFIFILQINFMLYMNEPLNKL